MKEFVWLLIGYGCGCVFCWLIFRPMKSWTEGYEDGRKHYSNWDDGFDKGFKAAKELYTDYPLGFKEGWHAYEKSLQEKMNKSEAVEDEHD